MTDTSSLATTHATTDPSPVSAPLSASVDGANSDSGAPDEGTIKCICKFDDDDGRTVQCGTCGTWQHLACYYHDESDEPDEDEAHNCNECERRPLDSKRAAELQRRRRNREKSEGDGRKKRPSVKSTKKKSKSGDSNEPSHQRTDSGVRDQPPSKKSKNIHRPSTSISALPGSIPPQDSRKRRSSTSAASSPTKVSGPSIPLYSNEFLHLYDENEEYKEINSNLFARVHLFSETASWVKNADALAQVANGRRAEEIFDRSDAALDRKSWPALTTETITDSTIDINGRHPTWKLVKTQEPVQKDQVIGEIIGKVGAFDDYCHDRSNRWSDLHHPEPFVFFSSQLPLYIDGRREGNMLRYTRRSCHPNVTMKIFITNEVEYHFCFVAKEDIAPGSEITIMWYYDPQLSRASSGLANQESGDSTPDAMATFYSNILANFGGCPCGQEDCLLAKFDRRQHPRALESNSKTSGGKRRKIKAKSSAAPDSGRASLSRAGSESNKPLEEEDAPGEARSTSGSARGQTISRDLSPTNPHSRPGFDLLSDRERRKIAKVEKQFEQLEKETDQKGNKKKKRPSGPSIQSPVATQPGGGVGHQRGFKSLHINTRDTRDNLSSDPLTQQTTSPETDLLSGSITLNPHNSVLRVPSSVPLPNHRQRKYVDVSIQCDLDHEPTVRRPIHPDFVNYVPFNVRNLRRVQEMFRKKRVRDEAAAVGAAAGGGAAAAGAAAVAAEGAPTQQLSTAGSGSVAPVDSSSPMITSPVCERVDAIMTDVATIPQAIVTIPEPHQQATVTIPSISRLKSNNASELRSPGSPPWASMAAHSMPYYGVLPDVDNLHISMPPPASVPAVPAATSPVSAASLASPSAADASSPQSAQPAGVPTPPPAKKKLSFADYINRRGNLTTPTSEKTHAQAIGVATATSTTQQQPQGPVASSDDTVTPTKPSLDSKPESPESRDVVMKDASDSTQPHVPSISS